MLVFCICINVFAQISYEFDFNDDGIFEYNLELVNIGDAVQVDIWLDSYDCPPSDELFGVELYFFYNSYILQVNDAYPNDSNHGR